MATDSISQLMSHQRTNTLLDVIDDCSTEDISLLRSLVSNPSDSVNIQRRLTINERNLGLEINHICKLNDDIYDKQEFVYLADNDVAYSLSFDRELQKLKQLMHNDPSIFASTLFNVHNPWHLETEAFGDDHVCKTSFGGVSILIRAEDFRDAMDFYLSPEYLGIKGWDWAICHFAKLRNKKMVASKMSFVQHIGLYGQNTSPTHVDIADNFVE
jgi:hypothetical protein